MVRKHVRFLTVVAMENRETHFSTAGIPPAWTGNLVSATEGGRNPGFILIHFPPWNTFQVIEHALHKQSTYVFQPARPRSRLQLQFSIQYSLPGVGFSLRNICNRDLDDSYSSQMQPASSSKRQELIIRKPQTDGNTVFQFSKLLYLKYLIYCLYVLSHWLCNIL